jgi:transcriptional regulator with XRE-family HTH domain
MQKSTPKREKISFKQLFLLQNREISAILLNARRMKHMEMKEIIVIRRKELGLTLEDVANRVGVSRTTVQRWEKGVLQNPGRDKIATLAAALQVSPEYLLGWTDDPGLKMEQDLAAAAAGLTPEETASVLNYIAFLKAQRRKK